jgi:esterase/lipase superfamily enzyme
MSRVALLDPGLSRPTRKGKGIAVVVHGIHTDKDKAAGWMPALAMKLRRECGMGVALMRYGWTSGVSIRMPVWGYFSRRSKLAKLRRLVRRLQKQHPGERISIVAHSFGTWLAFWAGFKGRPAKRVDLDRVVLMAPIIDVDQEFPADYGPRRIACYFSREDDVIRKAPFGHAGAWGFSKADGKRVVNRDFTPYEHGDYTEPGGSWDAAVEFLRAP